MSAGAGSLSILQHAQARTGQAYVPINNQQAYAAMGAFPGVRGFWLARATVLRRHGPELGGGGQAGEEGEEGEEAREEGAARRLGGRAAAGGLRGA